MRNTQKKIEEALAQIATEAGFELVVDYRWPNIGTGQFQRPTEFIAVLAYWFDFQDCTLNLSFYVPKGQHVRVVNGVVDGGLKTFFVQHTNGKAIQEMLSWVKDFLYKGEA